MCLHSHPSITGRANANRTTKTRELECSGSPGDCVSALPARHNRSSISWGGGAVEASTSKEGGQRRPALAGEGIGGQHQEVGPGEVSTSRAGGQGDWRSKKGLFNKS
eukprot:scaffold48010_cov16-Tisochrysis_lutea.AAC.1